MHDDAKPRSGGGVGLPSLLRHARLHESLVHPLSPVKRSDFGGNEGQKKVTRKGVLEEHNNFGGKINSKRGFGSKNRQTSC